LAAAAAAAAVGNLFLLCLFLLCSFFLFLFFFSSKRHPAAQPLAHIACLPREILHKIFARTLPRELDLAVYALLARVCRQWYVAMANFAPWFEAATLLWGAHVALQDPWFGAFTLFIHTFSYSHLG
jgi:hypothetical protein